MRVIKSLPFKTDFYWQGDRYRQFMRVKDKNKMKTVACFKVDGVQERVAMPSGRRVKPVIKFKLGVRNEK